LLAVHYLKNISRQGFDNKGLQAVKLVSVSTFTRLDEFPDVVEQLGHL
jgi:hypothetical protein